MLIYIILQARSSAWLERHLDMVEVVGSSPIVPILMIICMIITINNKDFQVNDGDSLENIIKKNFKKRILLQQELMRDYLIFQNVIKENSKIELITTRGQRWH